MTLFVAVVAGCACRFYRLGQVGLWYDELWTVVGSSASSFAELRREWIAGDPHPPGYLLFYFLYFKLFPNDEFWARLPNAISGAVNVLYVLLFTRRTLDRSERLTTAALFALSHGALFYSVSVKQYAVMLTLVTVSTITYLSVRETKRIARSDWLSLWVTSIGLAYLNYFATIYAFFVLTGLGVTLRSDRAQLQRWALLCGCIVLFCTPLVPSYQQMLMLSPGDWQSATIRDLAADILPFLFFTDSPWVTIAFVAVLGISLVGLLATASGRTAILSPRNRDLAVMTLVMTAFLLLLGQFKPVFFIRYFLVVFPGLFIAMGIILAAAWRANPAPISLVLIAFSARATLIDFRMVDTLDRQHWNRSVDMVLAEGARENDVYILGAMQNKTMLEYLQAQDVFGFFYVRNLSFYRYYFRRRGAADVAQRLEAILPSLEGANALVTKYAGTGKTLYVLGGHHIKFDDDALEALRRGATDVQITPLFSTKVYRIRF